MYLAEQFYTSSNPHTTRGGYSGGDRVTSYALHERQNCITKNITSQATLLESFHAPRRMHSQFPMKTLQF